MKEVEAPLTPEQRVLRDAEEAKKAEAAKKAAEEQYGTVKLLEDADGVPALEDGFTAADWARWGHVDDLHYWRSSSGREVDFVVKTGRS